MVAQSDRQSSRCRSDMFCHWQTADSLVATVTADVPEGFFMDEHPGRFEARCNLAMKKSQRCLELLLLTCRH